MAYTMFSPIFALVALLTFLAVKRIYYELTTGAQRRKMIRDNGCEPPFHYQHEGVLGKLFGADVIRKLMASAKQGRMHSQARLRNFAVRNTIQTRILLTEIIFTIEPENVKTILSTKFHDFELGQRRARTFIPVFGHGIFDTDGAAWERSRAMIRPNFTRSQVADLDTFETHITHLIDTIPKDGATVDLQDLFFSLTMDSATQFLFGTSTSVLEPGSTMESAHEFVEA